jgi:hypothetical protein
MDAGALETVKMATDVATSVVTIVAILVGAVWGYWTFLRERTRWPKATLELIVSHRELTPERSLLHAKVKVHNAGRGLMKLTELRVDVHRVLPLDEATAKELEGDSLVQKDQGKAKWPRLKQWRRKWGDEREPEPVLEPGENDEFDFDFVVPSTLQTVYVYVYVKNVARKRGGELGWTVTDLYDLPGEGDGEPGRPDRSERPKRAYRNRRLPDALPLPAQQAPRPDPLEDRGPGQEADEPDPVEEDRA